MYVYIGNGVCNSSVSIGCEVDNQGIVVHVRVRRFLFSPDVQTGCTAYPASIPGGTEVTLPRFRVTGIGSSPLTSFHL